MTRCIDTGVAGLSIEDSTGRDDQPLYEEALAVERIRAARAAIDASQPDVFLTGRCEAFLVRHPDRFGPLWRGWWPLPRRAQIASTPRA